MHPRKKETRKKKKKGEKTPTSMNIGL